MKCTICKGKLSKDYRSKRYCSYECHSRRLDSIFDEIEKLRILQKTEEVRIGAALDVFIEKSIDEIKKEYLEKNKAQDV